jgi:hypothetical protein
MELFLRPNSEKDYGYSSWSEPKTTENLQVVDWIDRLSSELSGKTNDHALRDDLAQICKMVIRQTQKFKLKPAPVHSWQTPSAPFSDDVIASIMTTTLDLDNEALFLDTYAIYSGKPKRLSVPGRWSWPGAFPARFLVANVSFSFGEVRAHSMANII